MLVRIHCDKFSNLISNKTIQFHQGLSCIVGTNDATNSIGKTLLLLIVDYCFGGTKYVEQGGESDVIRHIGNHDIDFTFEFDGARYNFKRKTNEPNTYYECDDNFKITSAQLKLDSLRAFLKDKYVLSNCAYSFREIIDRFMRIYGKDNYDASRPISIKNAKESRAINTIEMLFDKYDQLSKLKDKRSSTNDEIKAYSTAQKYFFISSSIKSKKQLENKKEELEKLKKDLEKLIQSSSNDLEIVDTSLSEENLDLISKHDELISNKNSLNLKLKKLSEMTGEAKLLNENDVVKLKEFFPEANLKSIEKINEFQKKIINNVNDEISNNKDDLINQLEALNKEIKECEDKLKKESIPSKITNSLVTNIADKKNEICNLEKEIKNYEKHETLKQDKASLTKELLEKEKDTLTYLNLTINTEMKNMNDSIYNEIHQSPVVDFKDADHYSFSTPNDHGNGTEFKNIIILDLALLKTSKLPLVIHDSPLFKNIGDEPAGNLFKLYSQFKKQIFVSIDRVNALDMEAQEIIDKTKVVQLGENEESLFGFQWNLETNRK